MDTGAVYNLKNQLRGHSDNDTSSLASLVYSHNNTRFWSQMKTAWTRLKNINSLWAIFISLIQQISKELKTWGHHDNQWHLVCLDQPYLIDGVPPTNYRLKRKLPNVLLWHLRINQALYWSDVLKVKNSGQKAQRNETIFYKRHWHYFVEFVVLIPA